MSVQEIRKKQNRPDLDYIWDLIDDGDFIPKLFSQKLKDFDYYEIKGDQIYRDVLAILMALSDSKEYENMYRIEGYDTLYDNFEDIPESLYSLGQIEPVFIKKLST